MKYYQTILLMLAIVLMLPNASLSEDEGGQLAFFVFRGELFLHHEMVREKDMVPGTISFANNRMTIRNEAGKILQEEQRLHSETLRELAKQRALIEIKILDCEKCQIPVFVLVSETLH